MFKAPYWVIAIFFIFSVFGMWNRKDTGVLAWLRLSTTLLGGVSLLFWIFGKSDLAFNVVFLAYATGALYVLFLNFIKEYK